MRRRSLQATTRLWLLLSLLLQLGEAEELLTKNKSPYTIVIDGGSTGSRLHIFEFIPDDDNDSEVQCERRGSERSQVPLSDFGTNPDPVALADHMMIPFRYAANVVPPEYHATTVVKFAATAGMRLLTEEQQEQVYDGLYKGLMDEPDFVFDGLKRSDLFTLSGELEGFYGAVAANFLEGLVNTDLSSSSSTHSQQQTQPLGALDMGGSSTQIVYQPHRVCNSESDCEPSRHLREDDFFSYSYLAYGVDRFRERLWDTWVEDRRVEDTERGDDSCSSKIIDNPCTFAGYEIEWKTYTLIGTGDATECIAQVQRLIPHYKADEEPLGGRVGGVEHPPVRGKFFAMSLFFFSLDSLRVLSHPSQGAYEALNLSWPTPSIQELVDALHGLCSRSWHEDLADIQHTAHAYTRAEVLPHRCLEAVYMVTLLRDGYGFEPESRDITFCYLVDGSEVEWSLGLALSMHSQQIRLDAATQEAAEANVTTEQCVEVPQQERS